MRREPSDAERRLWSRLRDRQLGGYKFRRQVPVHGYIVDFACIETRMIVEVDGSQHFEPEAEKLDRHRDAELLRVGWRTIRFQADVVVKRTEDVLKTILAELEAHHAPENPPPNPLPQAGEGAVLPLPGEPSPQSSPATGRGGSNSASGRGN